MIVSGNESICDKCVILFNGLLKSATQSAPQQPITEKKQLAEQLNSIKIREFLDQFVVGQDQAKMAICVSVVNHYKRMMYSQEGTEISKSNLLITGPSGSGKSHLVSTVAKFLDVPFIAVDATTLTEAGFIGQNVDSIIMRLLSEANWDIAAAEKGIVFIDEIDKIAIGKARPSANDGRISGVQSALLKMIEGTTFPISGPETKKGKMVEINTANILFIGGGAFIGLNEIVSMRLKKKSGMGFTDKPQQAPNIESEYKTEDFIDFGLIPEIVGRFPMKTYTKELTEEELFDVLKTAKNSILSEHKFYFNVDNLELDFEDEFLRKVAQQAKNEKTGVRGLRAICDSLLMPHLYLIPEYQKRNVAKVTFTEKCIDKKEIPKIEIFEQKAVAKTRKSVV